MKIGIIGAGWYGCHLALELAKEGHEVVLFEKNTDIFKGVSGKFGIRLHKGPHYPRSQSTRESCLNSFDRFCAAYPELVVEHDVSIYAHGEKDVLGHKPKVTNEEFIAVCQESPECKILDKETLGFKALNSAMSLHEPSIALGERLRTYFRDKLSSSTIELKCNFMAQQTTRIGQVTQIQGSDGSTQDFDYVINATGYQTLIPEGLSQNFPVDMEVVYQTCIALCYEDTTPAEKPLSFIVMDGWFPCLMPSVTTNEQQQKNYILTHGSYTIMGSYNTPKEAHQLLENLTDDFIKTTVKEKVEADMCRFWPDFSKRFEYKDWRGTVLGKLKTRSEFRAALTFEQNGIIYVFPGKVSNIFNAFDEVNALINNKDCIETKGIKYAKYGALDNSQEEIANKPDSTEQSTCNLQTYAHLTKPKIEVSAYSIFNKEFDKGRLNQLSTTEHKDKVPTRS